MTHLFLVDPVVRGLLPGLHLLGLEPESDLLLGSLNGVGAVADVAADVLQRITVSYTILKHLDISSNPPQRALNFQLTIAKSPRMVPGWDASGLVAPSRTRPVLTASRPSQTMAQMGPEAM
jgi:hypothetical protein